MLTSLPRSRPVRRSSKRGDRVAPDTPPKASAKPAAAGRPRAAKATAKSAAAKKKAPAARARTAATKSKTTRTQTAANEKAATGAAAPPRVHAQRKVPAAGYAAPTTRADEPSASAAAELVSTAIQAASELAQIGMTVGRQTLRSMLDRLPKP